MNRKFSLPLADSISSWNPVCIRHGTHWTVRQQKLCHSAIQSVIAF